MQGEAKGRIVGVDVGGTFTDLIELDMATRAVRLAKVPSTPGNQAFGVIDALAASDTDLAQLDLIIHGTTTTTNAVLERKLSQTGLVTTEGFRDILELGRRTRPQPYGMKGEFTPIIPRHLRLEVAQRMDAAGKILTALDEAEVLRAGETLASLGCEAVVIHFLHAYANPAHERRAAELLAPLFPDGHITMGHALLSETREYERGVTAAVNASVQPILARYVSRLRRELSERGYKGDVLVMNGNGGMVSSARVAEEAAKTVMSGPASGVMAAAWTGARAGERDLITYDMGGTSTDVALIREARPSVSNETELEYGMPIHVPMVDLRTIGAGGGSIARVTAAGLLQVGPESAGADPGPVAYGKGGTEPTISDANVLLGRLDPGRFGGSLQQVETVFRDRIAGPLGLTLTEAALAVIQLANVKMAGAIRMVSLSLGADPRDFALFAFGGAGPLHAAELARELAIPRVLVPPRPGLTNAIGCVTANLRHDFVRTINRPVRGMDPDEVPAVFAEQAAAGRTLVDAERVMLDRIEAHHSLDMQFRGQTHLIRVELPDPCASPATIREAFEIAYYDRFRVDLDQIDAVIVNVNTSVIGHRPPPDLSGLIDPAGRRASVDQARTGIRAVLFENGETETPVYWRDHLPLDAHFDGPALIEQMDTTILVEKGNRVRGDGEGNLILEISR